GPDPDGTSRVPALELDDIAQPEHRHRELPARRQALHDVPDPPVIGDVPYRNALHLQDDVAADDDLLTHDGGKDGAASQTDRIAGRTTGNALDAHSGPPG